MSEFLVRKSSLVLSKCDLKERTLPKIYAYK